MQAVSCHSHFSPLNCSLNWQHQLCKNPRPNPDVKTLFVDHSCGQPNGARAPSPVTSSLMGTVPKAGGFPPITGHGVSKNVGVLGVAFFCYVVIHDCSMIRLTLAMCAGSHFSLLLLFCQHLSQDGWQIHLQSLTPQFLLGP